MSKLKSTRGDLSSSTLSQNKKTPKERLPYGHSLSRMFRLQRYKKIRNLQRKSRIFFHFIVVESFGTPWIVSITAFVLFLRPLSVV